MFTDDCNWDTPKYIKALNETIFKLHPRKCTSTNKKRSHVHSDTRKQLNTNVANKKANDYEQLFQTQEVTSVAAPVVTLGRDKHAENEVYENCCPVKKKNHKSKCSVTVSSGNDDGSRTASAITVDQCSSSTVIKPSVLLAKYVKADKKYVKSDCNSESLSAASSSLCESLPADSSVPRKRRKRKQHSTELDFTVKSKKSRTVDCKSDEVCAVADDCSLGPSKCNFDIAQLRLALQHSRKSTDSKQDRLYDKTLSKNRTLQIDQKTATPLTEHEKVDMGTSATSKNSLPSETLFEGGSSGLLKERMMSRLTSARFRFINEQMYRSTGSEAAEMFAHDKDAFTVYHVGFQSQVSKWPTNPVDKMIDYINRSGRLAVVVDFGCGDAKIARSVPNIVHSYDLVALNEHVTACDMAHVPLKEASVDIAVFCLSLMGTNTLEYIAEASRVLKLGGVLLIAEVLSRFKKIGSFVRKLRKLGFGLQNKSINKMFVWFEMKKICEPPDGDSIPSVELYPCVYKKR